MAERIPFTVIGGYLGAGKTTLLNHIIRNNDGRRFALLVNDFGSINIDAELIVNQDGDTMNLANGCVCCSLAGGFVLAIDTLLKRDPLPEHIIVEASGVADTYQVAQYGKMRELYLDGVIVVVDVELIRQKAQDKYVGRTVLRQLDSADVLVLNKVDLVEESYRLAVREWLAEQVPDARIIDAQHGVVPIPLVLGIGLDELEHAPSQHDSEHHEHQHDSDYDTWSYESDAPVERAVFERFISRLPDEVVRAKGFVYLREDASQRHVFQMVGKRWSLKPDDRQLHDHHTQIVLIGRTGSVDPETLSKMLEPD